MEGEAAKEKYSLGEVEETGQNVAESRIRARSIDETANLKIFSIFFINLSITVRNTLQNFQHESI